MFTDEFYVTYKTLYM